MVRTILKRHLKLNGGINNLQVLVLDFFTSVFLLRFQYAQLCSSCVRV
jgi:DNA polymerase sigma